MIKTDPIIAVRDVEESSKWYQSLLGCKSMHGGKEFDVLVDEKMEVVLCLHLWGSHEHPTMENQEITPGNGLIIYFRTDGMDAIYKHAKELKYDIEEDIHQNPNTRKREFSLRDLDGYYLTITDYHKYEG